MWSFGHQNLKLPRDFFHHYTLPEFIALTDRYHEEQDYWPSQHYAQTYNMNRDTKKDSRGIDHRDLMRVKRKPKTKKEILKSLVNPNAFNSLKLFAQAKNAFVDSKSRPRTTKKRGAS